MRRKWIVGVIVAVIGRMVRGRSSDNRHRASVAFDTGELRRLANILQTVQQTIEL